MSSPPPPSSSLSSSPGVTMQAYPVRSLDADSESDTESSTRTRSRSSSNMEMNLISQSFPAGMISDDIDVDVDVDDDVTDVEKGQEWSVTAAAAAAAAQQEQKQEHSVASEEVLSRGLTTTTTDTTTDEEDEDEKASFRRRMMLQQKSRPAQRMSIRIASLSHNLRQSVRELHLDVDGDGELDTDEILSAVQHLTTQTKTQSSLRKIVCALCTFLVVLVACVFASTMTAARLVLDTAVDPTSGIMYANKRGSGDNTQHTTIMKTEWVALSSTATTVAQMTNADLNVLQDIRIGTAGVKFQLKGYARKSRMRGSSSTETEEEEEVRILVEGGTLTYDRQGIIAATGTAQVLLTFAYGEVRTGTHYHLYGPHDVYVSGGKNQVVVDNEHIHQ